MKPSNELQVFDLDDPKQIDQLSAVLRDWEPALELYKAPRGSFLYEPDGTLYAIALRDGMTFATDCREVKVRMGDLIVLPQGHGVEAGDDVDLIAFRHDGSPPDHFRERFIQVWGFDHLPVPSAIVQGEGYSEIVRPGDVRFRIPYVFLDVNQTNSYVVNASEELRLVIAFEGNLSVDLNSQGERRIFLRSRQMIAIEPGHSFRVGGIGRMGLLAFSSEIVHEARRNDAAPALKGPEYRPEGVKE